MIDCVYLILSILFILSRKFFRAVERTVFLP
jgi:hypothetical protein